MFVSLSYARRTAWSVLWRGRRGWRGLVGMSVELQFDAYFNGLRGLTLLLKCLDDLTDSLYSMLVRLLSH